MILFTKIEHIVINNTSALIITQNFAFIKRRQMLRITIQVHMVMMQKSVKQTCWWPWCAATIAPPRHFPLRSQTVRTPRPQVPSRLLEFIMLLRKQLVWPGLYTDISTSRFALCFENMIFQLHRFTPRASLHFLTYRGSSRFALKNLNKMRLNGFNYFLPAFIFTHLSHQQ